MSEPTVTLSRVQVPIPIVFGRYELLSNEELREHIVDVTAEQDRRLKADKRLKPAHELKNGSDRIRVS